MHVGCRNDALQSRRVLRDCREEGTRRRGDRALPLHLGGPRERGAAGCAERMPRVCRQPCRQLVQRRAASAAAPPRARGSPGGPACESVASLLAAWGLPAERTAWPRGFWASLNGEPLGHAELTSLYRQGAAGGERPNASRGR